MVDPRLLARLRNVPTRAFAAGLTFGLLLGLPALFGALSAVLGALDLGALAVVAGLLAALVMCAGIVVLWIAIFRASGRIKRAETALYAGDYDTATREAHGVVRTVFRSDYQLGALFTLALAAERLGAFAEGAILFGRALAMMPAMAAQRPRRRASALLAAHAALDLAATGDLARANDMLGRCQRELGPVGQPGALESLLRMDDSGMGAIGLNTMLVELESRRDPRPLSVLAWMVVALKSGQAPGVLAAAQNEAATLQYGLAPHEQALAARVHAEALRLASGAGPTRTPGEAMVAGGNPWAGWVLGQS